MLNRCMYKSQFQDLRHQFIWGIKLISWELHRQNLDNYLHVVLLSFRPFVRLGSGLFLAGVSFIASALLQLAIDVSFVHDVSEIYIYIYMSHFAYACKMWYPLNLVLENIEYLWFYWTFCIVILDYGLKLHNLTIHTLVMLQKWLEIH